MEYTYDAWGNILTVTGGMANTLGKANPLRYRGYVYDEETRLYYLQSRYYDPELGRFINADIFVATGQDLLGYNMFAYCLNNPVNNLDPSGEFALGAVLTKVAVGAAVNVLTTFIAAKVTGQSYTWRDAGVAAISGAIGSGSAISAKILAGAVSGLYAGVMAYQNGASLGGAITAGVVSGVGTTFAVTNIATWVNAPLGSVAAPVVDTIFGTSANTMSAISYRVAVDSAQSADPIYLAPPRRTPRNTSSVSANNLRLKA